MAHPNHRWEASRRAVAIPRVVRDARLTSPAAVANPGAANLSMTNLPSGANPEAANLWAVANLVPKTGRRD